LVAGDEIDRRTSRGAPSPPELKCPSRATNQRDHRPAGSDMQMLRRRRRVPDFERSEERLQHARIRAAITPGASKR